MNDNGNGDPRIGLWRVVAVAALSTMLGWWSRQVTLEIPPAWFREDVRENTENIAAHEQRLDKLDRSDPYDSIVKRLLEIERQLDKLNSGGE